MPTPVDSENPITSLSKAQRRVLGVLVEKGLATPEYYPLTLKAATAGCNQKNNRDPVAHYSEDDVYEALDQLREVGLVAFVHTEAGRTERYRHYMRHRLKLTEPQLAVLTELLLRGSQQLGELRTRASRMVPIESQEQLRSELAGLISMGLVEANAPLERRGAEVDHTLYPPQEKERRGEPPTGAGASRAVRTAEDRVDGMESGRPPGRGEAAGAAPAIDVSDVRAFVERLDAENRELRDLLGSLQDEVRRLADQVHEMRRELGG